MKFFIILLILLISVGLFYRYVIADDIPVALKQEIALQPNPFTVAKDSTTTVWQRTLRLLEGRRHLLSGGELIRTDSTLYLPYYNNYHKGNSILIESHTRADSVVFKISWWYSGKLQENGSKEIALFMEKGISRYGIF